MKRVSLVQLRDPYLRDGVTVVPRNEREFVLVAVIDRDGRVAVEVEEYRVGDGTLELVAVHGPEFWDRLTPRRHAPVFCVLARRAPACDRP
jgi:hypothetical protein